MTIRLLFTVLLAFNFISCKKRKESTLRVAGGQSVGLDPDNISKIEMEILKTVAKLSISHSNDNQSCTGVLVGQDILLTAGHCLLHSGGIARTVTATFFTDQFFKEGSPEFMGVGSTNKKEDMIVHPKYKMDDKGFAAIYDIGLVKLRNRTNNGVISKFIMPAKIIETQIETVRSGRFVISGYGRQGINGRSNELIFSPILNDIDEDDSLVKRNEVRLIHPTSGACFGDSGGPAYRLDDTKDEIMALAGINIRGNCGDVNDEDTGPNNSKSSNIFSTIFIDLSRGEIRDWVTDNIEMLKNQSR